MTHDKVHTEDPDWLLEESDDSLFLRLELMPNAHVSPATKKSRDGSEGCYKSAARSRPSEAFSRNQTSAGPVHTAGERPLLISCGTP